LSDKDNEFKLLANKVVELTPENATIVARQFKTVEMRPGWGYTEGRCIGVGHQPFEESPKGTKEVVKVLTVLKSFSAEILLSCVGYLLLFFSRSRSTRFRRLGLDNRTNPKTLLVGKLISGLTTVNAQIQMKVGHRWLCAIYRNYISILIFRV
jgi:hypothetical protein